jgi:ABC-type amino acid transport substrate-binding protein
MAHALAGDLGAELVFVPFEFDALGEMLSSGQLDIAMSCIASLPDRYSYATFSQPYLHLSLSLVVLDHEREEFSNMEKLREREELTIAMISTHYFENRLRRLLPDVQVVYLTSAEEFFSTDGHGADALMLSYEEGVAYSYRYPRFTVVRTDRQGGLPAAYPLPKGDIETVEFMNNWIELKRGEGTIDELYQYWMLGGLSQANKPRWSVIRDVLGWVD